jgi:hypothetical protein
MNVGAKSPTADYLNPSTRAAPPNSCVRLVDEVDRHHERAKRPAPPSSTSPRISSTATVPSGIDDGEGQRWSFAERVRDVGPEDIAGL